MNRTTQKNPAQRGISLLSALDFALRAALFAALWAILLNGDSESWILGVPVAIIAALISVAAQPVTRWSISPYGALLFTAYFLRESLLSSIDVSRRVLSRNMRLTPGLIYYPLRLKGETARAIMANSTSLLPGTLSISIEGDTLIVHALDRDASVAEELRKLEQRVAGIYGIRLTEEAL